MSKEEELEEETCCFNAFYSMSKVEEVEEGKNSPDWANILDDLLICIADKVHSLQDLRSLQDRVRMGAVCRSWRASLKDEEISLPICLMLAEKETSDKRCFLNPSEEMFMELELPEIRGRRCWGSSFGWLLTCGLDLEIKLFNPLSKASLSLPSLLTFPDEVWEDPGYDDVWEDPECNEYLRNYFIGKFYLSSNPTSPDSIVFTIYSMYRLLAFAKPGDEVWTLIDSPEPQFSDIICYDGRFFAVRFSGSLYSCQDLHLPRPKVVKFAARPPKVNKADEKYLFHMGENLCMASRIIVSYGRDPSIIRDEDQEVEFLTGEFEIYKLDMHTRNWERILSLGDWSLFLGNCCTFTVIAADYYGCRPNCIYFADECLEGYEETGGNDIGIYNCDNKERYDFPKLYDKPDLWSTFSPPLWFKP